MYNEEKNYDNREYRNHYEEENSIAGGSSPKKPGKGRKAAKFIAGALVFGLVAGSAFQGVNMAVDHFTGQAKSNTQVSAGLPSGDLPETENNNNIEGVNLTLTSSESENTVSQVADNVMPAIVAINCSAVNSTSDMFGRQYQQQVEGSGSGIIIGQNEKEVLIVTNNHVVSGDEAKVQVVFSDETAALAVIKGTDSSSDLAVVAVNLDDLSEETRNTIRVASLGDSDSVKVGEMAIAIGNALGYGQSLTVGYISAKDRQISIEDATMTLLQTDAAINPGNSGGALLNINGQVVGINSVKYSDTDVEGIGYAIPISEALPIINDLMSRETVSDEEKGYLGISCEDITEEDNKYNMPTGVYVTDVAKKGAAKEAGMIKGDIITKINGMEVTSRTALQERVGSYRIGTEVTVTIKRYQDGEYIEKELKVTLKGLDSLNDLTREEQEQQGGGREQQPQVPDQDQSPYSQYPSDDYGSFFDFFNNFMR